MTKKISEFTAIPTGLTGSEEFLVNQDGTTYKATIADMVSAAPDANGIYPDVPLNRVTVKRSVGQSSYLLTVCDNTGMIDKVMSTAFPCLIDRSSNIVAMLNGNNPTKTVDNQTATLDDYTMPCMVRVGGFYRKYEYDAVNNVKIKKYSIYPVRGYKYVRRRFLPMYGGTLETVDSKQLLLSNSGKYTTQNAAITTYHTAAKNLGDNFRAIAHQDLEIYNIYQHLTWKHVNSQKVYGISGVASWDKIANEDGGKTSYGQFYANGITNSIAGHQGETSVTVTDSNGTEHTVKPYKFLWMEGFLAGPFWIRCTGRLFQNGKCYNAVDINTNTSFAIDSNFEEYCDIPTESGYISEMFEDSNVPSAIGASDSTGYCDYFWAGGSSITIPVAVGSASDGSNIGSSCLDAYSGVSYAYANLGSALASDDPTDTKSDGAIVA